MQYTRNETIMPVGGNPVVFTRGSERQRFAEDDYDFDDLLDSSPALTGIVTLARKISGSDIPVLLTGESGVGKELFARAIHNGGRRSLMPFVPVNCGALPDNLVESALFGHEKGAFTGAVARAVGKCREANGGVLFLDEVGELKLETQVKLLRMLQQGEVEPVGSGRPVKVDVRVISATNRPLEKLVASGHFREDLYYRLRGVPLHIPALRERKADAPVIASRLLARIAAAENRPHMRLASCAGTCLAEYDWPGNVRELQHVLHSAALLSESDTITAGDILPWLAEGSEPKPREVVCDLAASLPLLNSDGQLKTLEQVEREVIEMALARYGSHVGRTAAALGIGQSTLYKRLAVVR